MRPNVEFLERRDAPALAPPIGPPVAPPQPPPQVEPPPPSLLDRALASVRYWLEQVVNSPFGP